MLNINFSHIELINGHNLGNLHFIVINLSGNIPLNLHEKEKNKQPSNPYSLKF